MILEPQTVSLDGDFDPRGFFVYRLYDEIRDDLGNFPIYIGQSTNVLARLGKHLNDKERRPHIKRVSLTRCFSESQMMRLETSLIREWQPRWNKVGVLGGWEPRVTQRDRDLWST